MGYQTYFELEIYQYEEHGLGSIDEEKLISIITEFRKENEDAYWALNVDGTCKQDCHWYDHIKDLTKLSKKYPDLIFRLMGAGDSNEDLWHHYFKDGKSQICEAKITFDEYNPDLLE